MKWYFTMHWFTKNTVLYDLSSQDPILVLKVKKNSVTTWPTWWFVIITEENTLAYDAYHPVCLNDDKNPSLKWISPEIQTECALNDTVQVHIRYFKTILLLFTIEFTAAELCRDELKCVRALFKLFWIVLRFNFGSSFHFINCSFIWALHVKSL